MHLALMSEDGAMRFAYCALRTVRGFFLHPCRSEVLEQRLAAVGIRLNRLSRSLRAEHLRYTLVYHDDFRSGAIERVCDHSWSARSDVCIGRNGHQVHILLVVMESQEDDPLSGVDGGSYIF